MKDRVRAYMRKMNMAAPGETLLLALSGGSDSVALLLCLKDLREEMHFSLAALHVNHGIRGKAADEDEAFVRALCEREQLPLSVFREDIPARAAECGEGLEEAGRRRRYELLAEEALRLGAGAAVTAHHRDDQSETVLMNLLRGSGPEGLAGMAPVSPLPYSEGKLRLIRPLLTVSKTEILDYLREKKQDYREDASNRDERYSRNRIRESLLPLAETLYPGAARHAAEFAGRQRELLDYLELQENEAFGRCIGKAFGPPILKTEELKTLHPLLRQRVLRRFLKENGGLRDVSAAHYAALEELLKGSSGRSLDLPGGRRLCLEQGRLSLQAGEKPGISGPFEERQLRQEDIGTELTLGEFRFRLLPREMCGEIPQKQYTKWLDYDKILWPLSLRSRRAGDYFLLEGGGRKSLQRYFVDEAVPAGERDRVPLLTQGSHVLWIVGGRISAGAKLDADSRRILEIRYGGDHGEACSENTDQ